MHLKYLALGLAVVTAVPAAVATAQAEDGIYIPLMSYRTGPVFRRRESRSSTAFRII